jgi:hypothetical protein
VQSRFEALKARREAGLDARRDKLAQKLHAEEQQLKQELVNSQETPAQRRTAMAARAREMARRREAERQQLANELMEQVGYLASLQDIPEYLPDLPWMVFGEAQARGADSDTSSIFHSIATCQLCWLVLSCRPSGITVTP